jgi:hypothetical protein
LELAQTTSPPSNAGGFTSKKYYNNQIIISNKANYLVENTNYHHNHLKKICNKYLKPPNNTVCLVKQRGPSSSAYWIFNWAPLSPKAPQAAKAAGAQDFWG